MPRPAPPSSPLVARTVSRSPSGSIRSTAAASDPSSCRRSARISSSRSSRSTCASAASDRRCRRWAASARSRASRRSTLLSTATAVRRASSSATATSSGLNGGRSPHARSNTAPSVRPRAARGRISADRASIWRTTSMCALPRRRSPRISSDNSVRISARPSRSATDMCMPSGSGGNARNRSVRGARDRSASATATRRMPPSSSSRSMAHTSASHDAASRATPWSPASGSSDRASISLACSSSSSRICAAWAWSSPVCSSAIEKAPARRPSASLIGAPTTWMRMREPSLRTAGTSPCQMPPARMRLRSSRTTGGRAAPAARSSAVRPTTSPAGYPNSRSAWRFQDTIAPSRSVTTIAAGACSIRSAPAIPARAISGPVMSRCRPMAYARVVRPGNRCQSP